MIKLLHYVPLLYYIFGKVMCGDQVPQPLDPYGPVIYPPDYCHQIQDEEEFDFIVVGSGPAGAAVSRRLAENPKMKVLLMEAGDDPLPATDIPTERPTTESQLWDMRTVPSDRQCAGFVNKSCTYILAKMLGGASVVNLMMYNRGNRKDYDEWGRTEGCEGWKWKDIFPYFKKLENYRDPEGLTELERGVHGYRGPLVTSPSTVDPQSQHFRSEFLEAIKKLGVPANRDFSGKSQIGVGAVTGLLSENGFRYNVAKAYLLSLPSNMKVCKNAVVTRVIFNSDKVATHVEFHHNNSTKNRRVKVKRDAVLSAGVLNTPQILERSGIGNATILKSAGVDVVVNLPGVGENLQDQYTNLGCAFDLDFQTEAARNPMSLAMVSFTIFLNMTDYKDSVPDLQWLFVTYVGSYMKFNDAIAAQFRTANPKLMAGSEVLRQSIRGYVHIRSTDPLENPEYDPMQFTSKEETTLTVAGCRLIRKAMADPALKKFRPKPFILDECKHLGYNSEEEIMCHARLVAYPAYHMAGTAAMGSPKDKRAVVDKKLRVHGVKKVRVCDLSAMPNVPRGNTEVPSIAIGEKCADVIKEDHP